MKKKWIIGTVIVVLMGVFGTVAVLNARSQTKSGIPKNAMAVQIEKTIKQDIQSHITAKGSLELKESKKFFGTAANKVEKVYVKVGDSVKEGKLLLEYDSTNKQQLETQLEQALINVDIEEMTLESLEDANASSNQIKMQKKKIQLAKIQVDNLEDQIDDVVIELRSPINGIVTAVNVASDNPIDPTKPVVEVGNFSTYIVKADISEFDSSNVKLGQEVEITGDALGERVVKGTVSSIAPTASKKVSQTGEETFIPVEIKVNASEKDLRPGITVDVEIITANKQQVVTIPLTALIKEKDGTNIVYTVKNYTVEKKAVTLGAISDIYAEILDLNDGEEIISNPTPEIKNGLKVQPIVSKK